MKSVWPFGFFSAMSSKKDAEPIEEDKQEIVEAAEETVAEEVPEETAVEEVIEDEIKAPLDYDAKELPPDDVDTFEAAEGFDDTDDSDDYDFEIEWDYLLETEEEIEAKKKTRKKVIVGLTILGAAGLATGFAIRSFLKNR